MIVDSESKTVQLGLETFSLESTVANLAEFFGIHDTGLMPTSDSGMIYHRSGLGSEQIVYQYKPSIRPIGYKENEGDSEESMIVYELAFPYWIAVISYEKSVFQGIRHFFSPDPIYSLDQQLYVPSLPNTNTRGYSETSVGWVCLYHQAHDPMPDLRDRLSYALARHDPLGEPYNYGNMGSTDGFTGYRDYRSDTPYVWDPRVWAEKTKEDGLDWVLNAALWMPIEIETSDTFAERATYYKSGIAEEKKYSYTLRHALFAPHYGYYDKISAKELNEYTAAVVSQDAVAIGVIIKRTLRKSIVAGSAENNANLLEQPAVIPKPEIVLNKLFTQNVVDNLLKILVNWTCACCSASQRTNAVEIESPNVAQLNAEFLLEAYNPSGTIDFDNFIKKINWLKSSSTNRFIDTYSLDKRQVRLDYLSNYSSIYHYCSTCVDATTLYHVRPFERIVLTGSYQRKLSASTDRPQYISSALNENGFSQEPNSVLSIAIPNFTTRKIYWRDKAVNTKSLHHYTDISNKPFVVEVVDKELRDYQGFFSCRHCDSMYDSDLFSRRDVLVFAPGDKNICNDDKLVTSGISDTSTDELIELHHGCINCCQAVYDFTYGVMIGPKKRELNFSNISLEVYAVKLDTFSIQPRDAIKHLDKYKLTNQAYTALQEQVEKDKKLGIQTAYQQYILVNKQKA